MLHSAFAGQAASPVEAVSVADPGFRTIAASGGDSGSAALSGDGRFVAFVSSAVNLVTNVHHSLKLDIYVRDRQNGSITLVSASTDGRSGGNDNSDVPTLSADGRWITFESRASNLVTNQTRGVGDIFVRDLLNGITYLVSVNPNGQGGNGNSTGASITPDGRFVVFESAASDLAPNDANEAVDVFVRDLKTGLTTLVSQNWQGTASGVGRGLGNGSASATITPDGRYVGFQSLATNLISPALLPSSFSLDYYYQIYVRDLQAGSNALVSISADGQPGENFSTGPLISADSRYVVFQSNATNLVGNPPPPLGSYIFRRDLQMGKTTLIGPVQPAIDLFNPASEWSVSSDGSVIAYVNNDQVYVRSDASGTPLLVSTNAAGQPSSGYADMPLVSADGKRLVFQSYATDLVPGVTNETFQIYFYDLVTGTIQIASASPTAPAGSGSDCLFPAISADGRVVAFDTYDGGLIPGDNNHASDVFVRDATNSTIELISLGLPATAPVTGATTSTLAGKGISTDGRYIVFTSLADNLVVNDTNGTWDVFVRDTVLGTNILVSVTPDGAAAGNGLSSLPVMTPDGQFVAFVSSATNLVEGDTNGMDDLFVRDMVRGTTTLASVRPTNGLIIPSPNTPVEIAISADGRYVAFDLVSGNSTTAQLFLRDLLAGQTTELKSDRHSYTQYRPVTFISSLSLWYIATAGSIPGLYRYDLHNGASELCISNTSSLGPPVGGNNPVITADERFVIGQWLTSPGPNVTNWVWRYDTVNRSFQTLVSSGHTPSVGANTEANSYLSTSSDGRYVAFASTVSPNWLADTNNISQVYVVDAQSPGTVQLVSVNQSGAGPGNGPSDRLNMSADGRFVTFRSSATDLVAGVTNPGPNIFVRDLQVGITRLVSVNPAGVAGDYRSFTSWLSADGTTIAFDSGASDLVPGDYNNLPDVFLYHVPQTPVIRLHLLSPVSGGRPSFVWTKATGKNYRVQFKNTLSETTWTDLAGTPVAYGANEWLFEDSSNDLSVQRYYRVVMLP